MRQPAYQVQLSVEQRQQLQAALDQGALSARELSRAQVLLMADEGKRNREIQALTGLTEPTVIAIKRRFVEEGLNLKEKPRPGRKPKLDSELESLLLELAGTDAPEGYEGWTMQLLADELMQREVLESISDETVRRILKKRRLRLDRKPRPDSGEGL